MSLQPDVIVALSAKIMLSLNSAAKRADVAPRGTTDPVSPRGATNRTEKGKVNCRAKRKTHEHTLRPGKGQHRFTLLCVPHRNEHLQTVGQLARMNF